LLSAEPSNDGPHREQSESSSRFSLSHILMVNIYIRLGLKFVSFYQIFQLHSQIWFCAWSEVFSLQSVQRETGVHTAQYSVGDGGCLFEDRATGALS